MRGFHDFVVIAIPDQARSPEFASRMSDHLFRRLLVGIAGNPQDELGDGQLFGVQLHDLGENYPFELSGHLRAKTRPVEASNYFTFAYRLQVAHAAKVWYWRRALDRTQPQMEQ